MSFVSTSYFLFFPIVALFYFLLPFKFRWLFLLVSSYVFYMNWNVNYAFLMFTSTAITYLSGTLLGRLNTSETKSKKRNKKLVLALSLVSNLSILFFYKYFNFINDSFREIFTQIDLSWGIPGTDYLLPVGISFYTFQALSYTFDVYYGKIKPVTHFGKYALFVSFFPQLVAGPIERSSHLLPQFDLKKNFDYSQAKSGFGLIIIGIFKKVVIADRLGIVVNTVYSDPAQYAGFEIMTATIFFAFQIFCDFSAYTDIARGSARILGFDLMNNFDAPYFAKSIPEFWRKWHISLTTWFRDYLYIPMGGNRVSKFKWYRNIFLVFVISGLWHGASWNYVIWGGLHGLYQIIDLNSKKFRVRVNQILGISTNMYEVRIFKMIWTFTLVSFAWIFFRANTWNDSKILVTRLFIFNPWTLFDGSLFNLGLDVKDFIVSIISILILLAFWKLKSKHNLFHVWDSRLTIVKYSMLVILIWLIVIFGYYGPSYDESQFIYFQF